MTDRRRLPTNTPADLDDTTTDDDLTREDRHPGESAGRRSTWKKPR
ncbi:hypothetical protein [Streptomyces sp. NPDC087270]